MIQAMRSPERKAKVTPETLEESKKLREIWDMATNRPSQAVFAETFGIGSQTAVATFLRGTTPISKKAAMGFAAGLGCKIADFSPRLAAEISQMTAYSGVTETATYETLLTRLANASPETVKLVEIALLPDTDLEKTQLSPSLKGLVGFIKAQIKEEIDRGNTRTPS